MPRDGPHVPPVTEGLNDGEERVATLQTTPHREKGNAVLAKLASDGRWVVELEHVSDDGTFHFLIIRLPQEEG